MSTKVKKSTDTKRVYFNGTLLGDAVLEAVAGEKGHVTVMVDENGKRAYKVWQGKVEIRE
jgi:poly(3-hydroxyalkanoate) synthetase